MDGVFKLCNAAQYILIYANGVVSNLCHFFHKLTIQNGCLWITRNSENIKQTISHELLNGFCQNVCHTKVFIEFPM